MRAAAAFVAAFAFTMALMLGVLAIFH